MIDPVNHSYQLIINKNKYFTISRILKFTVIWQQFTKF